MQTQALNIYIEYILGSQSKRPLIVNDGIVAFLTNLISKNLISPLCPSERSSDSSPDISLKYL